MTSRFVPPPPLVLNLGICIFAVTLQVFSADLPLALELFLVPGKLNPILFPLELGDLLMDKPDLGSTGATVRAGTYSLQRAHPLGSLGVPWEPEGASIPTT